MSDTPERIWIDPSEGYQSFSYFYDDPLPGDVAYVREDLHKALEAEIQRLRATLSAITATDCYSRDECTAMARAALNPEASHDD